MVISESEVSEVGLRAWHLQEAREIESELGFSTSNFTVLPHQVFQRVGVDDRLEEMILHLSHDGFRNPSPTLTQHFTKALQSCLPDIIENAKTLEGEDIIVRPSPLDELAYPSLSFAGVYKGYMPLRAGMTRNDHLLHGTAAMLAGRFTEYGNYYYDRHHIEGGRQVGAILMQPFFNLKEETPLIHGTAYVAEGHIRNEYNLAAKSGETQREPHIFVQRNGQTWLPENDIELETSLNFFSRAETALYGLQSHFGKPLDVEYLVDPKGDLYVVQLREISARHKRHWEALPEIDESAITRRAAILNSIGSITGKVIDLRFANEVPDIQSTDIVVIRHENQRNYIDTPGFCLQALRRGLSGIRLIIDHSPSRLRDHLQYAIVEDPGIDFIVQTSDHEFTKLIQPGKHLTLRSNGLSTEIV